jgi:hypothetical protein
MPKDKTTKGVDVSILPQYQAGAAYAASRINAAKKSSGGKKRGKSKRKVLKPPVGGWKAGENC